MPKWATPPAHMLGLFGSSSLILLLLFASPAWGAISCAILSNSTGSSNTDATTYATNSVTLVANRLYLLFVSHRTASGPATAATASQTGATWEAVTSQGFNNDDTTGVQRLTALRTLVASNATDNVDIAFGGQTQTVASWGILECSGVDTSGTNGSGAIVNTEVGITTGGPSLTLTFDAYSDSNNRPVVSFATNATAVTGMDDLDWTQLFEAAPSDGAYISIGWRDATDDTTVSQATSAGNADFGGIGIEVKVSPQSNAPRALDNSRHRR